MIIGIFDTGVPFSLQLRAIPKPESLCAVLQLYLTAIGSCFMIFNRCVDSRDDLSSSDYTAGTLSEVYMSATHFSSDLTAGEILEFSQAETFTRLPNLQPLLTPGTYTTPPSL